jgi:hypothetical protein
MNQVFQHLKIKKSWEEVENLYYNWPNYYKHDRYKNLSVQELEAISQVFEFKSNIIYTRRNQFIDFLSKNKEFYNDDLDIVINRMIKKRDELATQYGYVLPCLNWYPEYGGMMQDPKIMRNRELNYRDNNNIPYTLYVQKPNQPTDNQQEQQPITAETLFNS